MEDRPELPGWRWGPFTFRVPFYHTRLCWSEFLQGLFVSAATGLALIPVMTAFFGLSFEEAVALSMIHASLIASIAALKRVFVDDAERFLLEQPIATGLACAICLIFTFSIPMQKLKERNRFFFMLGALGLLPGFLAAAIVGPLVGEVNFDIQWGFLVPPLGEALAKVSPLAIGWPSQEMILQSIPLALIAYIILFGDLVTGNEVLREGLKVRKDEHVDINLNRTHFSLSIRNAIMGIVAPFFPTQGAVWTGVHVIVVQRWKQGPKAMNSLHSGLASYYLMGLPFIFFLLPLLTGLKPLLGVALSLTLVLTGFACAYIAMSIPRDNASRGTVVLIGAALAFFEPWMGLLIGVVATLALVGWDRSPDPIPHDE